MESITLSSTGAGAYSVYTSRSRSSAPSGSNQVSMNSRQTAALLPQELSPVGQETGGQEVDTPQEQTRLVDDMKQTADKANAYMEMADTHLEFGVSEQTGRIVVSVIDSETKEVVRQIPPESLQKMADQMSQMRGLLFEAQG
jgi:flagellar protein FlaG